MRAGCGESRVDALLVQAVARLMHRREEGVPGEIVLGIPGSESDVGDRKARAERMHAGVEAERALVGAECVHHLERHLVLRFAAERAVRERLRLVVAPLPNELDQLWLDAVEDRPHSAVFMPGSKSSRNTSYGSSPGREALEVRAA